MGEVNISFLRECFDFDAMSGSLLWKARPLSHFDSEASHFTWHKRFCGNRAGSFEKKGYLSVTAKIGGKKVSLKVHRIVWAIKYGYWPSLQIDHINGNKADNRIENLRLASNAENMRNRGPTKTNRLGIKGVYPTPCGKKFKAQIKDSNGRLIYLGRFETTQEASAAYESAAATYHRQFANVG